MGMEFLGQPGGSVRRVSTACPEYHTHAILRTWSDLIFENTGDFVRIWRFSETDRHLRSLCPGTATYVWTM